MIINVRVKTNSEKQLIEKISGFEYKISLKSIPEDNKANIELMKLLKKHLNKDIKIIKGFKSRNKIIEVLN
jgi:uncharacterized protein (TIGR00251 family)